MSQVGFFDPVRIVPVRSSDLSRSGQFRNLVEEFFQWGTRQVHVVRKENTDVIVGQSIHRPSWLSTLLKISSCLSIFRSLRFMVILPAAMLALKVYFRTKHTFTIQDRKDH